MPDENVPQGTQGTQGTQGNNPEPQGNNPEPQVTPPATFKKQLEKEPAIKDDDVVSLTKSQLKDRLKRTEENALKNFMIDKENLNNQIKEKDNLLLEKDKMILKYEQNQTINKLENTLFKAGITDEYYLMAVSQIIQKELQSNPELKVEEVIAKFQKENPRLFGGGKIESFGNPPPNDPNLNNANSKTEYEKLLDKKYGFKS